MFILEKICERIVQDDKVKFYCKNCQLLASDLYCSSPLTKLMHVFADNYSPLIDVYAFGSILINLMSKRVYNIEDGDTLDSKVTDWAREKYYEYDEAYEDADSNTKIPKFSIVHESLTADPDFVKADEHKMSMLAVECTHGWTEVRRPTIKQVLRRLLKLKVVKQHAEFFGVKKS